MNGQIAMEGPLARLANVAPTTMVRRVLQVDAVVTGANGLAYLAAAGALDSVLGVPEGFLRGIGAFLCVFALGVWTISSRPAPNRGAVVAVAAANGGWVAASLVYAAAGWHDPSTGGTAWTVVQALTVAAFAAAQLWAVRRLD
ncbi:MAG TPA: hypothetical protein VHF58_03895 [Solirubrobacterales bacterium]|nr:hypothetical protein [Solirubrobacterales bacterium]